MTNLNGTKIVFALCLLLMLFTPYAADAYLNVDYPNIPIPEGSLNLNKAVEANRVTIGTIALFIYIVAIWMAGVIAFVSLIYAGLLYIVSGANPGARNKANKHLGAVAWGIGIVLFSFWMLFMVNPDVINLRVSEPPSLAGDPNVPLLEPDLNTAGGSCGGTFSCRWTGDTCILDEENTNCGSSCTAVDDCEAVNELNSGEAQEACESFVNVSCYQKSSTVTVADNSSSCFWQASQSGGSCIEVENCDSGYKSNVVCSAFDDEDSCKSSDLQNVSCVEEGDEEDPDVAGTFTCATGTSSCYYEETLDNCNEGDGYIADPDVCEDMDYDLVDGCGDTEHTCIKATP